VPLAEFLRASSANLLADLHVLPRIAALDGVDHHLAANLFAELAIVDAVGQQGLAEAGQVHAVVGGELFHRPVELAVADGDAALPGLLQQDRLVDQQFQNLRGDLVVRRQLPALQLEFVTQALDFLLQLTAGDDLVLYDGNDAVDLGGVGGHS